MTRKNARGVGGREKVTAAFPWSRVSLFSLVLILWPPYYLIVWHRWRLLPIKFTYFIYLLVCYLRKQFKPTWKQRRGAIPISLWLQRCSKAITKTGGFRGQLVSLPPPPPNPPTQSASPNINSFVSPVITSCTRKCLHKRVASPWNCFATPTWPPRKRSVVS